MTKIITGFHKVEDVVRTLQAMQDLGWYWIGGQCKPLQYIGWKFQRYLWRANNWYFLEFKDGFADGFIVPGKDDRPQIHFEDAIFRMRQHKVDQMLVSKILK